MPIPTSTSSSRELEGRRAGRRNDAGGQGEAHRAALAVDLRRRCRDVREGGTGLGLRAGDLLEQDRHADAPPARRVQRVLDRDVVVRDDRLDLDLAGHELGRHLEVQDVAGVVLDDVEDAGAAVDRPRGHLHLVRDRRGEDVAGARRVEHAEADEAAVHRLVARAAAGNEPDLALLRGVLPDDDIVRGVDADEIRMGCLEAGQALRDEVVDIVDELLHRVAGSVRRHGMPPSGRKRRLSAQASAGATSGMAVPGTVTARWWPTNS